MLILRVLTLFLSSIFAIFIVFSINPELYVGIGAVYTGYKAVTLPYFVITSFFEDYINEC